MKLLLLNLLLFSAIQLTVAQSNNTIDSLQNLLSKEQNDSTRIRLLLRIGSRYHHSIVKIDSALAYYEKALLLSQKGEILTLQIHATNNIAILYNSIGRYADALELLLKNLKLEEKIRDTTDQIFFTKREIILVYGNIGDYKKQLALAKELSSFAASGYFKNPRTVLLYSQIAYNILSYVYQSINKIDSALYYKFLTYAIARQTNEMQGTVLAAVGLAEIYLKIGKYDSSLYYARLGSTYAVPAGRLDLRRSAYHAMANTFQKQMQLDSSFHYAYLALKEHTNYRDTAGMIGAALLLSDLYKSRNKFDSAYAYLSYHSTLKDRSPADEKIKKVQTVIFNEVLHQKQLEQERKEAQQQYESRLKIYSLLAGLGVMLMLAVILYRNSLLKQKARKKIEKAYQELKATQAQLIQSEKMASLGELTAGIAHEIQNPLNFVNNFSEVNTELIEELEQEADKGNFDEVKTIANDIKENEQKIIHHGKRADAIVKGMLQHSRASTGKKELTDINALADEYLRLSYHGMRAKDKSFNATLQTAFDTSIGKINIVPQDIGRVLLNLFNNAFYAVTEKKKSPYPLKGDNYEPTVSVTTKRINSPSGVGGIEIHVKDNGNGIPQKVLDKIFQPFFTTKPTGQGTGLGLSLSYDIIKAHGGEIKVETKEGEGSKFVIQLPA